MMEHLMKTVDMVWYATDDPEICSHPANCLMVRMGKDVPSHHRSSLTISGLSEDSCIKKLYPYPKCLSMNSTIRCERCEASTVNSA